MFALLAVNTENILKALEIMWKGVVAIFIVIALVIVVTNLVNKACIKMETKRAEKEKAKAEESQNPSNQ